MNEQKGQLNFNSVGIPIDNSQSQYLSVVEEFLTNNYWIVMVDLMQALILSTMYKRL